MTPIFRVHHSILLCHHLFSSYTIMDLSSGFSDFQYTYLFPLGGGKDGNRVKQVALSFATNFPSKAVAHSPCMMGREQPSWNPSSLLSQRSLFPLFCVGFPVYCVPCFFNPAPSLWVDHSFWKMMSVMFDRICILLSPWIDILALY